MAPHPELQNALFCYALEGDGACAVLLRGWDQLVTVVDREVGCGENESWVDILAKTADWQCDYNGKPFAYHASFEDGAMSIYVISE